MAITLVGDYGKIRADNIIEARIADPRVYMEIDYTKGNEKSLNFTFGVRDDRHPNRTKIWYLVSTTNPVGKLTVSLTDNGTYLIPIPFPIEACTLIIVPVFENGDGTGGAVEICLQTETARPTNIPKC